MLHKQELEFNAAQKSKINNRLFTRAAAAKKENCALCQIKTITPNIVTNSILRESIHRMQSIFPMLLKAKLVSEYSFFARELV